MAARRLDKIKVRDIPLVQPHELLFADDDLSKVLE